LFIVILEKQGLPTLLSHISFTCVHGWMATAGQNVGLFCAVYQRTKIEIPTMICERKTKTLQLLAHWNYFLAIEQDVIKLSRYIEFSPNNYNSYSIELAHLLMASTSEVDVLLKEICISGNKKRNMGIHDYRKFFQDTDEWDISKKAFINNLVLLPRYNLHFDPWKDWRYGRENAPEWWDANNNIKHDRGTQFHQANLLNVLNSVSALLAVNLYLIRSRNKDLIKLGRIEPPKLFISEQDFTFGWGVTE